MVANQNNIGLAEKLRVQYGSRGLGAVSPGVIKSRGEKARKRAGKGKQTWRNLVLFIVLWLKREKEVASGEMMMAKKKLSAVFLLTLAVLLPAVMLSVISVCQIQEINREIKTLEQEKLAAEENVSTLELKLEEKNDIRIIEQMATASLGMVKEDSLQRRYISLSKGEGIEVFEEPSSAESGAGSLLSSLFSVFGDLLEYFK